jgi:hypothetical protein
MKNAQSKKPAFLVGTIVTVGAFCFWPHWLTGLFALGVVLSWIAYDSHDFLRAVWRTVLLAGIIVGGTFAAISISCPPTVEYRMQFETFGIVLFVLSIIGFVRSILNARKDWTME